MLSQVDDAIPGPGALPAGGGRSQDDRLQGGPPEVAVLAAWARFCGEPMTVAGVRASLDGGGHLPREVRAARDAVRELLDDQGVDPDLPLETDLPDAGGLLEEWMAGMDERELEVLRHRIMRVDRTLERIGEDHGVTRERIRQVESRTRAALDDRLQEPEWLTVRWAVEQLGRVVGAWAPLRRLSGFDADDDAAQLVAHLAGLHVDAEQEVLRRPGFALPGLDDLRYAMPEGVVVDERDAHATLRAAGVRRDLYDSAMTTMGLHRVHRVWVRWSGSYLERAIGVMAVRGEPMTAEDLARIVGAGSLKSLRDRLQSHPMTHRVTRRTVGLRSWGLQEYTGVVDLMTKAIAERGAPVRVTELAHELETTYDVRPGTVNAFASAPVFLVEGGRVRMRRSDEEYEVPTDPTGITGLRAREGGGAVFEVPVGHDVLRGSGRSTPEPLGGLLGLRPGEQLVFEARREGSGGDGSVLLAWPPSSHTGPQLGTLRPLVEDLGAQDGDLLRLDFDPADMVVTYARIGRDG